MAPGHGDRRLAHHPDDGHAARRTCEPIHGFAAETAAATVIETASRLGFPLSTTHVISSAILGVGASRRAQAVRWGVAGRSSRPGCSRSPSAPSCAWLAYFGLRLVQ